MLDWLLRSFRGLGSWFKCPHSCHAKFFPSASSIGHLSPPRQPLTMEVDGELAVAVEELRPILGRNEIVSTSGMLRRIVPHRNMLCRETGGCVVLLPPLPTKRMRSNKAILGEIFKQSGYAPSEIEMLQKLIKNDTDTHDATAASFGRFSRLPPELRRMIWRLAMPKARMIDFERLATRGRWRRRGGRAFKHVLSAPGMATAYDQSHAETRALGWREGVKLIVRDLDGSTVPHNKDNFFQAQDIVLYRSD